MRKIHEIKFEDEEYPEKLRKIRKPPHKLYAIGNLKLLHKPSLAIVGTRHITEYGVKNCEYFTREIVKKDIPIVSGMAVGTDSVAHKTTIEYGGETIAVLGSGFDNIFPKENLGLFQKIIEKNGLVVTEYPPKTRPKSERFLQRNRIVSGLSEGVLVIEASHRSGTSVTAKLAYSQGRVVMALPGRLDDVYGVGVNRLIQEGAKLVTDIHDVMVHFPQFMHKMGKTFEEKQISLWDVNEEYHEIIEILKNGNLSLDEITQNTRNKNLRETLRLLINMEIEGIVVNEIGGGYRIVKK